jgi:LacI family transcriptional regulator
MEVTLRRSISCRFQAVPHVARAIYGSYNQTCCIVEVATMAAIPKVALLLETSRSYGRGLLQGIIRYSRLHGPWNLEMSPGHFEQKLPAIRRRGLSGIIARISTPQLAKAIHAAGVPAIALEASFQEFATVNPRLGIAEIRSDSAAVGRLVAEYLLARDFRQFAYCGIPNCLWSKVRQEQFTACVSECDYPCYVYQQPANRQLREWQHELPILAKWLCALPRPLGVLAGNDDRGRKVLLACQAAGLQVPEDVAVIGVDNDELLCEVCDPPLSSVAMELEAAGYAAAELLDAMMAGRVTGQQEIVVKPTAVVTRRSSDVLAQRDRMVAGALQFIRDNAARPIGVSDVIGLTDLARTSVERRFRQATGRSILEEITRRRLERARRLLAETDLPMQRVAAIAGFSQLRAMNRAFHTHQRCTPWQYRKNSRT